MHFLAINTDETSARQHAYFESKRDRDTFLDNNGNWRKATKNERDHYGKMRRKHTAGKWGD